MQRFFQVTGPVVHQMVLTLERHGWISRTPGTARGIRLLVGSGQLPELKPANERPVKSNVQRGWTVRRNDPRGDSCYASGSIIAYM